MTLLELLVQELPKRGGWPDGAIKMSQDYDGEVWCWRGHDYGKVNSFDRLVEIADNHRKKGKDEDSGCFVTRKQYEAALAANKPEWDGDGLPPVGCECEFKADDGSWGVGAVLCVGKSRIFWLCHEDGDEYTSDINPKEFRPIRSEEDKKKEEAIEGIASIIDYRNGCSAKPLAKWLFEEIAAGKIPHIRID